MTIRLSLDCPHCRRSVTLDVGARVVSVAVGEVLTEVVATPVFVAKAPKSTCACGHGREWHAGDKHDGPCTYAPGRCDCAFYHARKNLKAYPVQSVSKSVERAIVAGSLGKGERVVLTAIAQNGVRGATKVELTVVTGYKRSTRDLYVQELSRAGMVENEGGTLRATPAGVDALGPGFEPLPSGDALLAYWLERLPEGERLFLEIASRAYPEAIAKEKLGQIAEYKRSTRDLYVRQLVRRQLLEKYGGPGLVRASPLLFDSTTRKVSIA